MASSTRATRGSSGSSAALKTLINAVGGEDKAVEILLVQYGNGGDPISFGPPLLKAAQEGDESMARLILERGCDVDKVGIHGYAASHFAAAGGHVGVLRLLLEYGAVVDLVAGDTKVTPLLIAASRGSVEMCRFLLEKGASMKMRDGGGKDAFLRAVQFGRLDAARLFLERGADRFSKDAKGQTALHLAATAPMRGSDAAVKFVLGLGLSVSDRSQTGDTPAHAGASAEYSYNGIYALEKAGADMCARNALGQTPLMVAAMHGHWMNCLTFHGVRMDETDNRGWNCFHYAIQSRSFKMIDSMAASHLMEFDVNRPAPAGFPWPTLDAALADKYRSMLSKLFMPKKPHRVITPHLTVLRWAVRSPSVEAKAFPCITFSSDPEEALVQRNKRVKYLRNGAWARRAHLVCAFAAYRRGLKEGLVVKRGKLEHKPANPYEDEDSDSSGGSFETYDENEGKEEEEDEEENDEDGDDDDFGDEEGEEDEEDGE